MRRNEALAASVPLRNKEGKACCNYVARAGPVQDQEGASQRASHIPANCCCHPCRVAGPTPEPAPTPQKDHSEALHVNAMNINTGNMIPACGVLQILQHDSVPGPFHSSRDPSSAACTAGFWSRGELMCRRRSCPGTVGFRDRIVAGWNPAIGNKACLLSH